MGHFCDGAARACVIGTPQPRAGRRMRKFCAGTAYQTTRGLRRFIKFSDRMDKFRAAAALIKRCPATHEPGHGPRTLCAVFVETDRRTGLAPAPPVRSRRLIPTSPIV